MVQDGGGLSKEGQQTEEAWMMEAERAAKSGAGETENTAFEEIKHELRHDTCLKKPLNELKILGKEAKRGGKRLKGKLKEKREEWIDDSKFKRVIDVLVWNGVPVAVVTAAAKFMWDKRDEWEWDKWLSEKWGAVSEKIPGVIGHPEKIQGLTPDQAAETHLSNLEIDYARFGMGGGLHIEALTDLGHARDESVIYMTAKSGGPNWLFAFDVNDQGVPIEGDVSDAVFKDLVGQLNLSLVDQADLKTNWINFNKNPDQALQWLKEHGVDSSVIAFYQYSIGVAINDEAPETWQDRIDILQNWQQGISLKKPENMEVVRSDADFEEVVDVACTATGMDFASVRGSMETVAVCGGDTVEMVNSYSFVPDVHSSIVTNMEMSASAYILIPLYLLRVGHDAVKDLKGDIKNWLNKQQYRQMFDALRDRGKKFLTQKGTDKGNFT